MSKTCLTHKTSKKGLIVGQGLHQHQKTEGTTRAGMQVLKNGSMVRRKFKSRKL